MGALLKRAVEISERFAGAAEAVALSQGLGYPVSWAHGVSKLRSMERPLDWPVKQWPVLVVDASIFCKRWAAQSHRLGWEDWELFGCHRRAPWGAIHAMGLVPMLKGDEIVAFTTAEAVIRTASGARQSYRRRPHDPLHPSERALLWELDWDHDREARQSENAGN